MSQRNASKSRCDIDGKGTLVDRSFDVRVSDPSRHHEIHFSAKQFLEGFLKSKELTKPRQAWRVRKKFDEEIASLRSGSKSSRTALPKSVSVLMWCSTHKRRISSRCFPISFGSAAMRRIVPF